MSSKFKVTCTLPNLILILIPWFIIVILLFYNLHFDSSSNVKPAPLLTVTNSDNHQFIVNEIEAKLLSKSDSNDLEPGLPAFVVIGPPKSGTTSLVHTLASTLDNFQLYQADNGENHFWNGGNSYVCLPDYCNITWLSYIKSWNENKVTLSYLNHSIWTSSILSPQKCTKWKYESIWQWIMCHDIPNITDNVCYVPFEHHQEKYCKKSSLTNSHNLPYCYFIESAPSYLRNPLIGIMYAMNMPKIKLLAIIRNPVNLWWSYSWHYFSHIFKKTEDGIQKLEAWIFEKKIYSRLGSAVLDGFRNISDECRRINNEIAFAGKDYDYDTKFEMYYRGIMGLFLKMKFVDNLIEPMVRIEPDTMFYVSLIFPSMLFWIQAFDEVYGRNYENEWNNLRFIQFEYMYGNQKKSFGMIYCWITFGKYECPLSDNMFQNVLKKEAKSFQTATESWKEKVWNLYKDCSYSMQDILLKDRKGLLMGQWIDWNND